MLHPRILPSIAAAVIFIPLVAHGATEQKFQRTLNVSSTPSVVVETGSGDVHVAVGSSNQVTIVGKVHAGHWGWGNSGDDKLVQQIVQNPPIHQSGNTIEIKESNSGESWTKSLFNGHSISIDYEITVPKGTDVKATSGSGNVRVEGISGPLQGNTGSGDVTAAGIQGTSKLETGSGNIQVQNASGTLKLNTGSGDIRVTQSTIGDAQAETGSGNIELDAVQGPLRAETGSGDITAKGMPSADWHLQTGSGSIDLTIPPSTKFSLDAKSDSGSIKTDLPLTMQGDMSKQHIHGTVNGGGSVVRAESGSGDVRIH